jgi:hypothetical protein
LNKFQKLTHKTFQFNKTCKKDRKYGQVWVLEESTITGSALRLDLEAKTLKSFGKKTASYLQFFLRRFCLWVTKNHIVFKNEFIENS